MQRYLRLEQFDLFISTLYIKIFGHKMIGEPAFAVTSFYR